MDALEEAESADDRNQWTCHKTSEEQGRSEGEHDRRRGWRGDRFMIVTVKDLHGLNTFFVTHTTHIVLI